VFSVKVDGNGETVVTVLKGAVALESKAGKVTVEANQKAAASASGAEAVAPLAAEDAAQWAEARQVALPRLEVNEPSPEKLTGGSQVVVVTGRSERGARVTVNGRPVALDVRAAFRAQVPAAEGRGPITVRAVDAKGFESVVEKQLSR
jgi:hypothetical protein